MQFLPWQFHVSSMFMNCLAQIWRIPTAHIGRKDGAEAHPLLCRYNLIQGGEREDSAAGSATWDWVHCPMSTSQSKANILIATEKKYQPNVCQSSCKKKDLFQKGYSTTSSSQEQPDNLVSCKDNPSVSEDGVTKASEMPHWWTDTVINPVIAPQQ